MGNIAKMPRNMLGILDTAKYGKNAATLFTENITCLVIFDTFPAFVSGLFPLCVHNKKNLPRDLAMKYAESL